MQEGEKKKIGANEQALQESRSLSLRQSHLLDLAHDAIIVRDAGQRVERVKPSSTTMPESSKLKSFPDFHPFTFCREFSLRDPREPGSIGEGTFHRTKELILSRVSARKKAFAQETGAAPKKTTDDQNILLMEIIEILMSL